jgi:hypothetical protein
MLYPETVESFTSNPKHCVKAQEYRVQNGRINGENRRTERGCGEEDMQLQLSRLEIL